MFHGQPILNSHRRQLLLFQGTGGMAGVSCIGLTFLLIAGQTWKQSASTKGGIPDQWNSKQKNQRDSIPEGRRDPQEKLPLMRTPSSEVKVL